MPSWWHYALDVLLVLPILSPLLGLMAVYVFTGYNECQETVRGWVRKELSNLGYTYNAPKVISAWTQNGCNNQQQSFQERLAAALDPNKNRVSDWRDIYESTSGIFSKGKDATAARSGVQSFLNGRKQDFIQWQSSNPAASPQDVAMYLLEQRKVSITEWIRCRGGAMVIFRDFYGFGGIIANYLDYTGRGTAFGLLIGLAIDRYLGRGDFAATLPIYCGLIGAFLHSASLVRTMHRDDPKRRHTYFIFAALVLYLALGVIWGPRMFH